MQFRISERAAIRPAKDKIRVTSKPDAALASRNQARLMLLAESRDIILNKALSYQSPVGYRQ